MQAFTSQIFRNLVRSYMEIRYWLMRFSWPISQGFYVSTILKITIAKSTNELQARLMIHEEWKKISKLETFLGPADVEDLKKPWESRERRGQFGQIWRIEVEGFFSFPTGIKKHPWFFSGNHSNDNIMINILVGDLYIYIHICTFPMCLLMAQPFCSAGSWVFLRCFFPPSESNRHGWDGG